MHKRTNLLIFITARKRYTDLKRSLKRSLSDALEHDDVSDFGYDKRQQVYNFTNIFMSSFYACRSHMRKNTFKLSIFFAFKKQNCLKNVGEIDYRWQFHQTFYEELFCMKMFCEAFHFLQLGFVIFLQKTLN